MMTPKKLLPLPLLLLAPGRSPLLLRFAPPAALLADAAAAIDTNLFCEDLALDVSAITTDRVCATYSVYTPSPAAFPNGSTIYLGPYGYDFVYWHNELANGTDTTTLDNPTEHQTGQTSSVSWEGGNCTVQIGGSDCASCSVCGDSTTADGSGDMALTTLRADCTNLPGGRKVDCEYVLVYYPFQPGAAGAATSAPTAAATDNGGGGGGGDATSGTPLAPGLRLLRLVSAATAVLLAVARL